MGAAINIEEEKRSNLEKLSMGNHHTVCKNLDQKEPGGKRQRPTGLGRTKSSSKITAAETRRLKLVDGPAFPSFSPTEVEKEALWESKALEFLVNL